jgi:DNA end-binding protein Ku
MAARAIWKGKLLLGDQRIPLKLYSAVEDRQVRFRLLHEKDQVPVKQVMVNPLTEDRVEYSEALRGYETDDGHMIVLDDEDLEAIAPAPSRDIEVLRFVEPHALPNAWYDRPYYLGPDGDGALGPWSALTTALEKTGREGVVRWTMRKQRYRGALRLHDGVPMLLTLRSAAEVVSVGALEPPQGRELDPRELEMAERLVEMLEGPFEPGTWNDTYRTRVMELIEAKAEGRTVSLGEYRQRRVEGASLEEALRASLEAAAGKGPAGGEESRSGKPGRKSA